MPENFPTRAPLGFLLGIVLGALSIVPILALWQHFEPPLERFYFAEYLTSELAQTPVGPVISFLIHRGKARRYYMLLQNGKPVVGDGPEPGKPLSVRFMATTPRFFHDWLRWQIYSGREVHEVMQSPIAVWVAINLASFFAGILLDFRRRKKAREGVKLRGPDLMTRREFNRVTKGDGFALYVKD